MPRAVKVGGIRSASDRIEASHEPDEIPEKREGFYAFRAAKAGYWLSLRRRKIERGPDGETIEVSPRSSMDSALDWIKFENHYFETKDPELAKLIMSKPGFRSIEKWDDGGEFWTLEAERTAQDNALERELREKIASRPDIAERVLRPGPAKDLVPPQVS